MAALRSRQPFLGLALAAAAGIVLADAWPWPLPVCLAATCTVSVVALWLRRTALTLLAVAVAFSSVHVIRHHLAPGRVLAETVEARQFVRGSGVVVSEPRIFQRQDGAITSSFVLRLERLDRAGRRIFTRASVMMDWPERVPVYGDEIEFTGSMFNLQPARNPGEFDFGALLRRRGIYSSIEIMFSSDGRIVARGRGSRVMALAFAARQWMQGKLTLDLENAPEVAGLVQSMVLGLKGESSEEVQRLFERTGTLHVFVVSGLHVGLLSVLVFGIFRAMGIPRRVAAALLMPLLFFYALVTGLSSGSIRAAIMGSVILGGIALDRPALTLNNLAAAFFLTLLWNTEQLFMPGLQFSFAVVLSIVLMAPTLQRWSVRVGAPDPFLPRLLWTPADHLRYAGARWGAGLVSVSFAAWIGSLAFTAGYFHLVSPSAILANVVVVPTAFVILGQGMLSLLSALVSDGLAAIFNNANYAAGRFLLVVVGLFAAVPGGYRHVEMPRFRERPRAEIVVLDVNAGGAAHVRDRGADWLVDCGPAWSYERVVRPYVLTRGIDRLDGILFTHGDGGHVGAASAAITEFHPRLIGDSPLRDRSVNRRSLHAHLAEAGMTRTIVQRGDSLATGGGGRWRVLYPPIGLQQRLADDKCVVLQLRVAGRTVLFMSDSGFITEQWLVAHEPDLRSDVLIMGSHRSDYSGTHAFMTSVSPAVVVLGRRQFSDTGRLADGWHARMAEAGVAVFEQEAGGAVIVEIFDDGITVRSFLGDQVFSRRKR